MKYVWVHAKRKAQTESSSAPYATLRIPSIAWGLEELKNEVKRLRMIAVNTATKLHDLAEEGLPNRWQEIPIVAQEAYEAHKKYFEAKKALENKNGS